MRYVSKARIMMCVLCEESRHIDHPDAKASRRACFIDYLKNKYLDDNPELHSGYSVGDEGNKSSQLGRQLIFSSRGILLDPEINDDHEWMFNYTIKELSRRRRLKDRRSRSRDGRARLPKEKTEQVMGWLGSENAKTTSTRISTTD